MTPFYFFSFFFFSRSYIYRTDKAVGASPSSKLTLFTFFLLSFLPIFISSFLPLSFTPSLHLSLSPPTYNQWLRYSQTK